MLYPWLTAVNVTEMFVIVGGLYFAFKIAKMADHPPLGWVLLIVAFALGLVRAFVFLYMYALGSATEEYIFLGQVITLPTVLLIFAGVYVMYTEFKEQLARGQAALLAPEGSAEASSS